MLSYFGEHYGSLRISTRQPQFGYFGIQKLDCELAAFYEESDEGLRLRLGLHAALWTHARRRETSVVEAIGRKDKEFPRHVEYSRHLNSKYSLQ